MSTLSHAQVLGWKAYYLNCLNGLSHHGSNPRLVSECHQIIALCDLAWRTLCPNRPMPEVKPCSIMPSDE